MSPGSELFNAVADKDYLGVLDHDEPRYDRIAELLEFKDKDIASAVGVASSSVRLGTHKIPPEVMERFREWASALNLVAQFFSGDVDKTLLWFNVENPLLGGVTPRDMIRIGRFSRLVLFIREALAGGVSSVDGHVRKVKLIKTQKTKR